MAPGPATYSREADAASQARAALDRTAGLVGEIEAVRRAALLALVELWPTAAWLAAGCRTARAWLLAYTPLSWSETDRLVRAASLCADHPELSSAVADGDVALGRVELLARFATEDRRPFLAPALSQLLAAASSEPDDTRFTAQVRYWAELVDQELEVTRYQPHRLHLTQGLFGNGEIHGSLSPSAFLNVASAIEAYTQDPDPADAPHRRSLAERRADALDDLAHQSLAGGGADRIDDDDLPDDDFPDDDPAADDTFDGFATRDLLDEALDAGDGQGEDGDDLADRRRAEQLDQLALLRQRLRHTERQRRRRLRRRTKARSGAVVNVHLDLERLAGRGVDDLEGALLRGEGWSVAESAARRLLCDSALVATLFRGPHRVLDANPASEQFTAAQRRAIAARDGCCVFPSCTRPPRWCDAHHLEHREHGGPSVVDNGALLCRFHHRLVHEYGWQLRVDDSGNWVAVDRPGNRWRGRPVAVPGRADDDPPPPPGRPPHQDVA